MEFDRKMKQKLLELQRKNDGTVENEEGTEDHETILKEEGLKGEMFVKQ